MGRTIRKTLRGLYEGSKSISEIIRGSVSSKAELEKLTNKLGLKCDFCWIDDYDPNKMDGTAIVNIDADHIQGSHWCLIYRNTWWFDPMGFPPARDSLNYLQYTFIPIQNAKYGACGLYCCLALWYFNEDEQDKLYELFQIQHY